MCALRIKIKKLTDLEGERTTYRGFPVQMPDMEIFLERLTAHSPVTSFCGLVAPSILNGCSTLKTRIFLDKPLVSNQKHVPIADMHTTHHVFYEIRIMGLSLPLLK